MFAFPPKKKEKTYSKVQNHRPRVICVHSIISKLPNPREHKPFEDSILWQLYTRKKKFHVSVETDFANHTELFCLPINIFECEKSFVNWNGSWMYWNCSLRNCFNICNWKLVNHHSPLATCLGPFELKIVTHFFLVSFLEFQRNMKRSFNIHALVTGDGTGAGAVCKLVSLSLFLNLERFYSIPNFANSEYICQRSDCNKFSICEAVFAINRKEKENETE